LSGENHEKIDRLEKTVFKKDARLTVFEEIYDKIAQVEGDRKTVEQVLEENDKRIMKTFESHEFKYENHEKNMATL
jgi:5'-deoxynucleotidase YfbR-like HD superfamily hydrolase